MNTAKNVVLVKVDVWPISLSGLDCAKFRLGCAEVLECFILGLPMARSPVLRELRVLQL